MSIMNPPTATPWGAFIEPASDLENVADLAAHLKVTIHSGLRARFDAFRGRNRILDSIGDRIRNTAIQCEDQCSAKHYVDMFECVRAHYGRVNRLVEVGVYMGGASTVLAGCALPMDVTLDLVDPNRGFLQFTHERIRRTFPEAIDRVRLFLGDLPTYVHNVLVPETGSSALIHHDGAHDFNQVVKDLSSLSYVRDRVQGLMIQDTHLRGAIDYMNFVDAAVYAVFGFNVSCQPMGSTYTEGHTALQPNEYQGNYFLADTPEGMFIPFKGNHFMYPHPSMKLEALLPKRR